MYKGDRVILATHVIINKSRGGCRIGHRLTEGDEGLLGGEKTGTNTIEVVN